tara:strand:- start:1390 stop:1941 length:552 start_codon:yes stop_codon:yes gene_type:complete
MKSRKYKKKFVTKQATRYSRINKKKTIKRKIKKNKSTKRKIKKNRTTKSGGSKRINAAQPMHHDDQREINLCLSTPQRFSKEWIHQNLVSNNHLPMDHPIYGLPVEHYIETWNNHINMCNQWKQIASQHVNDGTIFDYFVPNLLGATFNFYDPQQDAPPQQPAPPQPAPVEDDDDEWEDVIVM